MPGPALPAWVLWVLGAAAAGLVMLVTYFVTSSKAKARAAKYKQKVLRIVEALKKRLDLLEEALNEARRAKREAEARAEQAERAARSADADREAAEAQARAERERAERAAHAAVELERKLAEARAEMEKWRREADVADRIGAIAGAKLTKAVVLEVRAISAASLVLGGKLPRPEKAMEQLDERLAQVESTNAGMERSLKELASTLAVNNDTNVDA
jgi:hypothetical protein